MSRIVTLFVINFTFFFQARRKGRIRRFDRKARVSILIGEKIGEKVCYWLNACVYTLVARWLSIFDKNNGHLSLSVASPRLEIEKLLSLVFLGLRYASDTLLWIEGKKKRGEPRERAGARVSFRVPASVSVPNPRRDFDRCRFYPEPKSLLHQISNQIWRRKRYGHRTNSILLKNFHPTFREYRLLLLFHFHVSRF